MTNTVPNIAAAWLFFKALDTTVMNDQETQPKSTVTYENTKAVSKTEASWQQEGQVSTPRMS